jgi:hypothetical protein
MNAGRYLPRTGLGRSGKVSVNSVRLMHKQSRQPTDVTIHMFLNIPASLFSPKKNFFFLPRTNPVFFLRLESPVICRPVFAERAKWWQIIRDNRSLLRLYADTCFLVHWCTCRAQWNQTRSTVDRRNLVTRSSFINSLWEFSIPHCSVSMNADYRIVFFWIYVPNFAVGLWIVLIAGWQWNMHVATK